MEALSIYVYVYMSVCEYAYVHASICGGCPLDILGLQIPSLLPSQSSSQDSSISLAIQVLDITQVLSVCKISPMPP